MNKSRAPATRFFDWKPNDAVKATFAPYGVPYATKMKTFFEQHLYGESPPQSRPE